MTKADLTIVDTAGIATPTRTWNVEAGAVKSIEAGEPVKIGGTGNNFVVLLADNDPEVGTDRMVGIAASDSTDTVAANGTVEVYMVTPGQTVIRGKATSAASIDTQAELDAIIGDSVTMDLVGGTFTINAAEGDDPDVHGLMVLGGDITEGTVDVVLKEGASLGGLIA